MLRLEVFNLIMKGVDKMEDSIFGNNMPDFVLPTKDLEETSFLISSSIEEDIAKDIISTDLMEEEESIHLPNYLIEFNQGAEIEEFVLMGLSSLADDNGDTFLYLKIEDELFECGMINGADFSRLCIYIQQLIIADSGQIYKNYDENKPLTKISIQSSNDITTRRMNI